MPGIGFTYTITDAYGNSQASGNVNLTSSVSYTPADGGFFQLNLPQTSVPNLGTLSGTCTAGSLAVPSNWSLGCNPFGIQGGAQPGELNQTELAKLGLSWIRCDDYNIQTGSQTTLPTNFSAYQTAWEQYMESTGLPATAINTYEVWNEPHNQITPISTTWSNSRMDQFVSMVSATRAGIHSVDSTAKIAVNWEAVSDFTQFNNCGGTHLYDVMTLHPYSPNIFATPPSCDSPEKAGLLSLLQPAHTLLSQFGISSVAIWSTEFGWPTAPGYTSELNEARYIVRSSLQQLAQGLTGVCPFTLDDIPWFGTMNGSFGLRNYDETPKPAIVAYSVLAQTVGNLPYAGLFNLGFANFGAFLFGTSSSAESVLVLWSAAANENVLITLPSGTKTETDLFGKTITFSNTIYARTIGRSPVYIVMNSSPSSVASAMGLTLTTGYPTTTFSGVTDSADTFPVQSPMTLFFDGFETNNFTAGGWTNSGCSTETTYVYSGVLCCPTREQ